MGSFEDGNRRHLFNQMIKELENIPRYSMGSKGSNLWIRDYEAVRSLYLFIVPLIKSEVKSAQYWAQEDENIWDDKQLYTNYKLFNMDTKNIHTRFLF